jgi:nickel-dependent lactate racemase
MTGRLRVPYGDGTLELDPAPFRLERVGGTAAAEAPRGDAASDRGRIAAALDRPIGSPRLEALVRPGERVLILVSDTTRPSAADRVLPVLLDRLARAGLRDEDVRYAVAGGLHPQADQAAAAGIVGDEMARRLRRGAPPPWRPGDFIDLGDSRRGTPIRVHRALVDADRVILTGALGFHYYAGFTGGRKSVLPGMAAPEAIAANHLLALLPDGDGREPGARVACLDGNPVHQDMAEACARIAPTFLVNVVPGAGGRVEAAFAGHWDRAHRRGCAELLRMRTVLVDFPRDLVVVSPGGHPRDIDLIQTHKAIDMALPLVRPGGAMIVLARCERGPGHPVLDAWLDGRGAAALGQRLRKSYEVYGQTAHSLRSKAEEIAIWLVSEISRDLVRRTGMRAAPDPDAAVQQAAAYLGGGGAGYLLERGAELLVASSPPPLPAAAEEPGPARTG